MFIPTACNFYLFRSTVDRKQLTGLATSTARNIKTFLVQPYLEAQCKVVDNKHYLKRFAHKNYHGRFIFFRPIALFYRTDCTRRSKSLMHAYYT